MTPDTLSLCTIFEQISSNYFFFVTLDQVRDIRWTQGGILKPVMCKHSKFTDVVIIQQNINLLMCQPQLPRPTLSFKANTAN